MCAPEAAGFRKSNGVPATSRNSPVGIRPASVGVIRFAFNVLSAQFPGQVSKQNTIVIASSVSNGGGASLRAAEQDWSGLIDGVAVSEPNVNPIYAPISIQQGSNDPIVGPRSKLIDYVTLLNLYEGCAVAGSSHASDPLVCGVSCGLKILQIAPWISPI